MAQVNLNQASKSHEAPKSFKRATYQITLVSKGEEPIQIEAGSWRGIDHIGIRQLFRGNDGLLYFGKQGFNCPVGDLPTLVISLLECYNAATGSTLSLHDATEEDEEALSNLIEDVVAEMQSPSEQVNSWSRNG